jgi:Putative transposase
VDLVGASKKADRLESEVWPIASVSSPTPARQWILTFPHQVRYWLARSPKLFAEVIRVVTGEISFFYEQSSVPFSKRYDVWCPTAGAASFVQLFGSSLALNPHLHMIFADGAWGSVKGGPTFFPLNGFTTEAMFDVLAGIHGRLDKLFRRRGYVRDDGEAEGPELAEDVPIPFRPRAPKAFRRSNLIFKMKSARSIIA